MFTGIVEKTGRIQSIDQGRLALEIPWNRDELTLGQSVAVNGCCLTIAFLEENIATFDLSPETFSRTTFGKKKADDRVNLERSLLIGDRLDGHFVSGHVDSVGSIRALHEKETGNWLIWINTPPFFKRWIAEKGSVAIDGTSFTVNEVDPNGFSIMVIPHTLKVTTMGERRIGDEVNLEFDLLAKYAASAVMEMKK